MKKLYKQVAVLAVAALIFSFAPAGDPLPIGSPIPQPAMALKEVKGKSTTLQDSRKANGLLVMFSCNSCPYVIKNQQRTVAICQFALQNNIGVVIVNSNEAFRDDEDSFTAMQTYAKEQGYNWNYVLDENSKLADAFGANRTPECFLFDKNDKLTYHGAIDNSPADASNVSRQHLQEAIKEMTAGKEVSVKESRSVGCTIKRKS